MDNKLDFSKKLKLQIVQRAPGFEVMSKREKERKREREKERKREREKERKREREKERKRNKG